MWRVYQHKSEPVQNYLMDKFCLVAFFILLRNITTAGLHIDTHRLAKRMDLESCLGQFDIHRDTIIRTEESQAIGGKFIQGLALETLEECQRLCCETDSCDVYIFEDKTEGYCYLFECGPPDNFRCKFTRHANYTSAVLTPIRHSTPPPSLKSLPLLHPKLPSPGLSQHERELTNLRQKLDVNIPQNKLTTTLIPSIDSHMDLQVTSTKNPQANNSLCRRFQFQCHSGECIAVYNACDGIPQCEDGSDEGPECPTTSINSNKSGASKSLDRTNIGSLLSSENVAAIPKQTSVQAIQRQYQQQSLPMPMINNREDPMSGPQIWSNRKIQDIQPDLERNSHIFNHKGGLQIATNNLGSQYVNPNSGIYSPIQRDMYMQPDIQNPYRNIIMQPQDHMIPPGGLNWQPQQQQQQQQQQQSVIPANSYVISVNGEPVPQVPQIPVQQGLNNNNNNNNNNFEDVRLTPPKPQEPVADGLLSSSPSPKNKHDDEKINHRTNSEESEEYSDYTDKSTEPPPKKKQRKHKKPSTKDSKSKTKNDKTETDRVHENPVHEQYKMLKEDLEMEFVDHDGQSERPGGAVLSLTLGVIVTAALAVLVGCRMRTVGRRVRRIGKAPYAHDADFLVNGMYL